jgi:NAD-dependent SIR2 family protein deacetylase
MNLYRLTVGQKLNVRYLIVMYYFLLEHPLLYIQRQYCHLKRQKNGATVIQVNTQPTDLDEVANFNFVGKAGEIISQLYQEVWGEI